MTSFQDKERAQETKYALDQEKEFKIVARRNKLTGLWLAEKMGYGEEKAHAYAKEVVLSDFEEPGDEDVLRKLNQDAKAAGVSVSEAELAQKMAEMAVVARSQIEQEGK
jgi:hypothetical protein